ncbi:hypothetical protein IFM89_009221, partial [Coptis chinensis]
GCIEQGHYTISLDLQQGAIMQAVIASGSSMKEALEATKVLAEDCQLRGIAFHLGVVIRELLVKFLPDDGHTRSNGRVRGKGDIHRMLTSHNCIINMSYRRVKDYMQCFGDIES